MDEHEGRVLITELNCHSLLVNGRDDTMKGFLLFFLFFFFFFHVVRMRYSVPLAIVSSTSMTLDGSAVRPLAHPLFRSLRPVLGIVRQAGFSDRPILLVEVLPLVAMDWAPGSAVCLDRGGMESTD